MSARRMARRRGRIARGAVALGRTTWLPILALLWWLGRVPPLAGQADRVATGAAGLAAGAVVGVWTTTAIYVAKARTGRYIFSPDDLIRLRWETLPIATAPIAGAVLGASSPSTLGQTVIWGGLGFLAGAGAGALLGHAVWGTSQARWAGGIIGSGVGLIAGIVFGALRSGGEEEPLPAMGVSIPIPVPGGGP